MDFAVALSYFQRRILDNQAATVSLDELLASLLFDGTTSPKTALQQANCILQSSYWSNDIDAHWLAIIAKNCNLSELQQVRLMAAIEFIRRKQTDVKPDRVCIQRAEDVINLVQDMKNFQQEHIRVILLDNSQCVIDICTVYVGTVDTVIFRASELFREAVIRNSPAIILVHNHLSGDPEPTEDDLWLTNQVQAAGKILDVQLIDHIIISHSSWVSLLTM